MHLNRFSRFSTSLTLFPLLPTASKIFIYTYWSRTSIWLSCLLFYWLSQMTVRRTHNPAKCCRCSYFPSYPVPQQAQESPALPAKSPGGGRWATTLTYSFQLRETEGNVCHSSAWQRTWAQLQKPGAKAPCGIQRMKGAHLICLMICKIAHLGVYLSNN